MKSGLIKKEWKLSFDESVTAWENVQNKKFETRCMEVYAGMLSNYSNLSFETNSHSHYAMIPSITYNGNHWGQGKEPKGLKHEDQWWTVSYRPTPIPGATYSEGDFFAVTFWGENPSRPEEAFSCSIRPEEQKTIHCLISTLDIAPILLDLVGIAPPILYSSQK